MEAIKEKSGLEKLTLAFAAVLTLVHLAVLMDFFTLDNLLWLLAAGALTWLFARGGKETYFWYAFLGVGVAALVGFFALSARDAYMVFTVREDYRNVTLNFFTILPGFLKLAGALGITALGGLLFASKFPALGDRLRRFWYLPALLFAVTLLYGLCLGLLTALYGYGSRWEGFSEFVSLRTLLWGCLAFCLGLRASGREELPTRSAPGETEAPALRYCSAAKLLFLTFITLGIWMLVWIYRTTAALLPYEGKHARKPWLETLCCLLLPFYAVYWLYRSAQLAAVAADGEEDRHFSTLCLVLGALLAPIAMLLVQDKLNVLADREPEIEVELEITGPEPAEEEPLREAPAPAAEDAVPVGEVPAPPEDEAVSDEEAPASGGDAPAEEETAPVEDPAPVEED